MDTLLARHKELEDLVHKIRSLRVDGSGDAVIEGKILKQFYSNCDVFFNEIVSCWALLQ